MKKIKQRKKVFTKNIGNGYRLKMRLFPWIRTGKTCIWLASLAASKSNRQINDWMQRRKNTRVHRLDMSLTGKIGIRLQIIAMRQVRQWAKELPVGHSMTMCCESAKPEKQFRAWKKWFENREDPNWQISEEYKSFFFYNKG
jgi:hypothetical protein